MSSPISAHFDGIVPCGVSDQGVTSLVDLGLPITMPEVDVVLRGAVRAHLWAAPSWHEPRWQSRGAGP